MRSLVSRFQFPFVSAAVSLAGQHYRKSPICKVLLTILRLCRGRMVGLLDVAVGNKFNDDGTLRVC